VLLSPSSATKPMSSQPGWSRAAHSLGGTCSGEHGVGLGKKRYLQAETARAWK